MPFVEVESSDDKLVAIRCEGVVEQNEVEVECGHVIKKRRDSFLPGLHNVICLVCGHESREVMLLTGEIRS